MSVSATDANALQAALRDLSPCTPAAERANLLYRSRSLPDSYVVTYGQTGRVMVQGMPITSGCEPMPEALARAKRNNVQTALLWSVAGDDDYGHWVEGGAL